MLEADRNVQFGNMCRSMRALKTRAAVRDTAKTLIGLVLVKCTGVGCSLQVSILDWVNAHLYTFSVQFHRTCVLERPVEGEVWFCNDECCMNSGSVARSVVLHSRSYCIKNIMVLLMPMMSYNYLIWVGRSPTCLFFRPSVQNFSGDSPLT